MNEQWMKIFALSSQIMADGELSYQSEDSNTLFQLINTLNNSYTQNPRLSRRAYLVSWMQTLDNWFNWDHPQKTELQEDQILTLYVDMFLLQGMP